MSNLDNKKENPNIHKGHRERVRQKFLKDGFSTATPDHEILEMLLFYSIPRQDTNPMAHNLINHFGGLTQLFEARPEDIMKVKGVSENTAVLIKMMLPVMQRYIERKNEKTKITLDDYREFINYVMDIYIGKTNEVAMLFLFNNKKELVGKEIIAVGDVDSVSVSNRKIVEYVLKYGATCIVLAHNHPQGFAVLSAEDRKVTQSVKDAVRAIDVHIIDHIVIANGNYYSMRSDLEFRCMLG